MRENARKASATPHFCAFKPRATLFSVECAKKTARSRVACPHPRERALPRKTRETGRRRTIVKIYDDTKGFEIAVPSVRFRVRGRSLFFCRFRRRFFYAYSRVLLLFRVLLRVLLRVGFGDRSFVGRAVSSRANARFEFSVF